MAVVGDGRDTMRVMFPLQITIILAICFKQNDKYFFWIARIVVAVGRHCESDGPTQELPHSCLLVSLLHSFNFSEESKSDKITQTIKWKVRTKSPM